MQIDFEFFKVLLLICFLSINTAEQNKEVHFFNKMEEHLGC